MGYQVATCNEILLVLQALIRKYLPFAVIIGVVLLLFLVKHWLS